MPFSATRDLWLVLKARDEGARAMRSFSRDVRMVGDSVQQANLLGARSALRNQLAMQRMTGASKQDQIATMSRIQVVDKEITQMNVHKAALEEQRVSAQKLSGVMTGAAATMTAFGTAMIAAGVFGIAGMNGLVQSAVNYQRAASLTRTQVDGFSASLKDMEDIGIRVASKIGVSFDQIQPALFDIFSSMEVNQKQAEQLLNVFAKAAVAGQTDIQSASKATIGIMNAFQLPLSSVNHLMDVQFQLVQEGVGTYEEWTQRIGLVSPSAVRAGQSVEMMAAALAATTRMGISAARSATAVSRAMDAMSNPSAVKKLKQLGVNAQDASGKFRPMIDVLTEFRTALQKVPEKDKIATILDVFKGAGGTVEARRFLQNMLLTPGNLEMFKSIFQEMSTQSGSFEKAYSIMADTAATKTELLKNKWEILKVKAGEALIPMFIKITNGLGSVLDWFNKLNPKTQQFITVGLAITLMLTGLAGIFLLIAGTVAAFVAAVVVAGSALFTVLGILTGVGAALAIFSAAIVIAWQKSSDFRDIILDAGKDIKTFYTGYILPTAKAVKDAFDQYLLPPLRAFIDMINTKVMPVLKDLQAFLRGRFLAALREIGNNIKDILIVAFKKAGEFIKNNLIPILAVLLEYYKKHESTIKMVIGAFITLTKWAMKIAAIFAIVVAVAFGASVLAAIYGFIKAILVIVAVVVSVVDAVKWLINWFKTEIPKAWSAVKDFTVKIWNSIVKFFEDVVSSIVNKAKGLWQGIVSVFEAFGNYLANQWNTFWGSTIGRFFKSIIDLILALAELFWTSLLYVFEAGFLFIKTEWIKLWTLVSTFVVGIWDTITAWLSARWSNIVSIAKTIWKNQYDEWVSLWNLVSTYATNKWNEITGFLKGIWNGIVVAFKGIWNPIADWVGNLFSGVKAKFDSILGQIKSAVTSQGSLLVDAGKNIIQGLIDGMTAKINAVTEKIKEITKIIRDHLPFSPAKIGPLSGKGSPYLAGQKISAMIADGMASKKDLLNKASYLMTSAVGTSSPSLTGTQTTGRTYNQNIVINTQELNPRRQAAELGFLLAGGM